MAKGRREWGQTGKRVCVAKNRVIVACMRWGPIRQTRWKGSWGIITTISTPDFPPLLANLVKNLQFYTLQLALILCKRDQKKRFIGEVGGIGRKTRGVESVKKRT